MTHAVCCARGQEGLLEDIDRAIDPEPELERLHRPETDTIPPSSNIPALTYEKWFFLLTKSRGHRESVMSAVHKVSNLPLYPPAMEAEFPV